jgi:hypothetical protein
MKSIKILSTWMLILIASLFCFGIVSGFDRPDMAFAISGLPICFGIVELLPRKRKGLSIKGINTDDLFKLHQLKVAQMFGKSLVEMEKEDLILTIPQGLGEIKAHNPKGITQSWKIEPIPDAIKQTMITASGSQPFMMNEAAADYFGGANGVFSPSVYGDILEGAAMVQTLPKLWSVQPFKDNELGGYLIYFIKSDPFGDGDPISEGAPNFARTAEGRAGQDLSFEMAKEHFDAQRYICHLPYSVEFQKILQGRLNLDTKVMEAFTEAAIYRDEYWGYHKWYLAMTAGTLEGEAFNLYTDAVIADVDGIKSCYVCFYNLTDGAIKCGDSTAYGAATSEVASGEDIFDLILYVIETMSGTTTAADEKRGYRYKWTPEYCVVPQKIANKLVRDYKDGTLTTVWVPQQDIPMYKDENNFLCRLSLGNKGIDVWVLPDEVMAQLAVANASTYVTTDSPTVSISPMFFGRYFGMAAYAPASPLLFFVDDGFEVVSRTIGQSSVSQLRRNQTKVHTMYQLKTEMLLNASQSFVVKVVEVE